MGGSSGIGKDISCFRIWIRLRWNEIVCRLNSERVIMLAEKKKKVQYGIGKIIDKNTKMLNEKFVVMSKSI